MAWLIKILKSKKSITKCGIRGIKKIADSKSKNTKRKIERR